MESSTSLEIVVVNNSEESHWLSFELVDDGETVFEQQTRIDGKSTVTKPTTTTLKLDQITTGQKYDLVAKLNTGVKESSTVKIDCPPEEGGDQFGIRVTSGDQIIIHDSECR